MRVEIDKGIVGYKVSIWPNDVTLTEDGETRKTSTRGVISTIAQSRDAAVLNAFQLYLDLIIDPLLGLKTKRGKANGV